MSASERVVARRRGERPGPTLLVTTVVHGNETAGLVAARRVLERLDREATRLSGDLVVLACNLGAMALGKRYQAKDLNRVWTAENVAALRARSPASDDAEDAEQRALLVEIDATLAAARGPVFAIDLHTTSAAGYAFGIYDSDAQDAFARKFPLPMVRGLAAALAGVLSSWLVERGAVAIAVEGGQHGDASTVDALERTMTVALDASGVATPSDLGVAIAALDAARGDIPRVMKVVARYRIHPGDGFVMAPGFANLAHVRKGQLLAKDGRRVIRAPANGLVILPLYQGQGDDGFFFGRAV